MAAYDTLRAAIDSYIKANGNKEITGTVLNDILNAMVSSLGADTRFAGVAVPTTNPGNPEGNVVYFASQAGTYSNFGGIVLPLGIHILVWNGTAWTSQTWFSVDNTPTQNSQNLATSGGILQAIVDAVGVERLRAIGAEVTSCSFDGTTKKISFFNSADDTLFQLDATAFVIDGMVSDVKIEDGNLVIQFNTDAGKQDIEIPLTDIFNPANYYTKTAIDALLALYYTKTETDALLTAINNKLADGCLYRGMAEPTTNPPTPTTKVFYIATKAGTYTNFGNIAVTEGITILKYDGSNWSKEQISYSDGVFDISAYNGTSYADLSAALGTNGANIPESLRKGGMSVKFVLSSDNKYVQFRLMSDTFNTTPADWQGIDNEPTAGSENLVKSGGTEEAMASLPYNKATTANNSNSVLIGHGYIKVENNKVLNEVISGVGNAHNRRVIRYRIKEYSSGNAHIYAKSDTDYLQFAITDIDGNILVSSTATSVGDWYNNTVDIPADAYYIYMCDDWSTPAAYTELSIKYYATPEDVESDIEPIQNSSKLVQSGGTYKAIKQAGNFSQTINNGNSTQLGQGYIKVVNNVVQDTTDKTSEGYHNRRVFKYDVSLYADGKSTAAINAKSDTGHLVYAFTDANGNILSSYEAQTKPDYINVEVTIPSGSVYIYIGDDYANPASYVVLKHFLYAPYQDDLSSFNLIEEYFKVRVNSTRPTNEETSDTDYSTSGESYYEDNCYVAMPNNVKQGTKLIIIFHGGGELVGTDQWTTNEFLRRCVGDTYRGLGYAVLMTNGLPDLWATEKGLINASAQIGNWMAVESTLKAYQYVCKKYDFIDKDGCYFWATSQGGMVAENVLELTDIPVKACCYQAPALSMRYCQLYLPHRLPWIEALYGFNSIATYSKEKCLGLDPFVRNIDIDIPIVGTTFAEIAQTDVSSIVSKRIRKGVPLLILHGTADDSISPIITQVYIKAINNAGGCIAKYKLFEGVGHGVASPTTEHFNGTTQYSAENLTPTPLYTTAGILEFAKWYYRYGGYPIPSGEWGNAIQ